MAKENTLKAEEEHKIKDAVESDLGNCNPMVKGEPTGIRNENERSTTCHECGKSKNCNLPLARCQSSSCIEKFCYQCIRKYQIDSFIKADFKHLIENPKICPVCTKQCKCNECGFKQEEDTNMDNCGVRKRSLRIREAK